MQIVVRLLKTSDIFADIIAQLNLVCSSCGTQVPLNAGQKWDFQENRKSCALMDGLSRGDGFKCWSGFAKFLSFVARFSCGARNLTSVVCGMLPIAISWKENKVIISRDGFSSSFIWAGNPVLSVALFDTTLALIFWLSISTHKTSNKIPC